MDQQTTVAPDSVAPTPVGWQGAESPFHAGEIAIQARLGVTDKIDGMGRKAIRPYLTDQHRAFFEQLPFVLAGAVDDVGQPWATLLAGEAGFMRSPDPATLVIECRPRSDDPLFGVLAKQSDVGLLGIEFPTRRRNRLNGRATPIANGIRIDVVQSFGNCPQYIQTREPGTIRERPVAVVPSVLVAGRLSQADRSLIASADTFFIATANEREDAGAARGADVSHRGGRPGFVRVDNDQTLTVPDFVGNFLFNTIGNIALDPRAGLLFIDWDGGDLLHAAVRAEVIWDGPELRAFAGAERLLRLTVTEVRRRQAALPLLFSQPGFSPLLERTGSWDDAARTLRSEQGRNDWRPFRVVATHDESSTVRSFVFEPADGNGVSLHEPGQHLPIRVAGFPGATPARRSYTLSEAANGRTYRISVKREGEVSTWLHDSAGVGAVIEALSPRGDFVFDAGGSRPAVLVSAGIGITPMIAMVNAMLVNEGRTRFHQPIFFVHGARNRLERAFAEHLRTKAAMHSNLTVHVRHSAPDSDEVAGRDFDSVGRVDMRLLKGILPLDDYDFYLCGPAGFMQQLYDGLRALHVPDGQIHFEAFGPSSVRRNVVGAVAAAAPPLLADGERLEVVFARSGRRGLWKPGDGTLLEFAEAHGIRAAYSCRAGLCGTCAVRVVTGAVSYAETPGAAVGPNEALLCCASPRPGPHLSEGADREGVTLDV